MFGGYHWYPPLADSNDVVGDYARVFFDRTHATLKKQLGDNWIADSDASLDFVREHSAAWRRGNALSTGRCGSIPTSCWSTILSSASTT